MTMTYDTAFEGEDLAPTALLSTQHSRMRCLMKRNDSESSLGKGYLKGNNHEPDSPSSASTFLILSNFPSLCFRFLLRFPEGT